MDVLVDLLKTIGPTPAHELVSALARDMPTTRSRASARLWSYIDAGWLDYSADGLVSYVDPVKSEDFPELPGMDCESCGEYTSNAKLNRMNPAPFDELICCNTCVDDTKQMATFVRGYQRGAA